MAWYLWVPTWIRGTPQVIRELLRGVLAEPDIDPLALTRASKRWWPSSASTAGELPMPSRCSKRSSSAPAEGTEDVLAAASMQLAIAGGEADMDEALTLFRKLGDDWGAAVTLCSQAWVYVHVDGIEGAEEVFDDALAAARRIDDDLVVAMVLSNVAEQATYRGDEEGAASLVAESIARYRRLRAAYPRPYAVEAAAHLATRRGR